jgi:hypothetical protein
MSASDGERTARSYVRIVVPRELHFT